MGIVVTGDVLLDSGAIHHPSGTATSGGVVHTSLSAQINDAIAASASAAALCSTYGPALNKTQTITRNGGQNVLCVQNIALGGGATLTLSGGASDTFIINIKGSISMGGGSHIVVAGGVSPSNVLLNVVGSGANLVIGGASRVEGTIMAIDRNMDLSAGFVIGSVISGRNINIGSGEQVRCPRVPQD